MARQINKYNVGDILFKPSGLMPLVVNRCMVIGFTLTDHAISMNYNSGKKLDDYTRGERYQIEYVVMEEGVEGIRHMKYTEEALYESREEALEYVVEKAKEVLNS